MRNRPSLVFYKACVEMQSEVNELLDCIGSARQISFRSFRAKLDAETFEALSERLGYVVDPRHGLTMKNDYHVGCYSSRFRGEQCVYVKWSAIEHIFVSPQAQARLVA